LYNTNIFNNNNNIKTLKSEKFLYDLKNGRVIAWKDKKLNTFDLANSYKRIGYKKKSYRVQDCGTFLEFRKYEDFSLKLNQANFCKVRLCPMCSWRRSLKIFGQVSKVMDHVSRDNEYEYLFLTLTCKNVLGNDLSDAIDKLFYAFNKMTKRVKFKRTIRGYFRALEVTHNLDVNSDSFDTYHPHFHIILVVNKSYFQGGANYISHKEWTSIWKSCLQIDYTPIVDIRRIINLKDSQGKGIGKSIAETAKYTVKSEDYIVRNDCTMEIIETMTDEAVYILDKALAYRRLTSFGGLLKEVHRELNLDDAEDGDLVNTDNEDIRDDLEYIIERYCWNVGYNQYLKVE
jgi:plasmid rolling circle replication initiator protein Rep